MRSSANARYRIPTRFIVLKLQGLYAALVTILTDLRVAFTLNTLVSGCSNVLDTAKFFHVGGTLTRNAPSYVERPADRELLDIVMAHELCVVMAPRQSGKSSLMEHAAFLLAERDVRSAIVDLQHIGSGDDFGEWFAAVIYQIERTLSLEENSDKWWAARSSIDSGQRLLTFVEDVVLAEISGEVVLFFDEVDAVLSRTFSDYYFTSIRALYNARASNPHFERLAIVLLGVATPTDFTTDRSRTPFNVGKLIFLGDFTMDAVETFRRVLGERSDEIIDRIFYWTSGQPFLVQQLAEAAFKLPEEHRSAQCIDDEVQRVYFEGDIKSNGHLKFISGPPPRNFTR